MKIFFYYRAFAFSVNFNKTIKFGAYIQRKTKMYELASPDLPFNMATPIS